MEKNYYLDTLNENPLLNLEPNLPIDFKTIIERKGKDFLPALEYYKKIALDRIHQIKKNTQEPNFENTVLALEQADQEIYECSSVFYVLFSAECIEDIQRIAPDVSSFLAKHSNDIYLDAELFKKIDYVYKTKNGINNSEQFRLTELIWKNFKRNGALLDEEKKKRLREIDEELSKLSPKFSENLLKSTNAFELHITDPNDLKGLPDNLIQTAKENAQKRNKEGWVFTLQMPEYLPFITYCEKEDLRKTMYLAFRSRGLGGETDNRPVIKRILELRHQRANLLGYKNHAEYMLEERMAKSPENVRKFLDDLYVHVKDYALKEKEELEKWIYQEYNLKKELQPWDYRYYAEKYKRYLYYIDQEVLRPYFPLENVLDGIFLVAKKLYNLSFKERFDVPVYHPEVKVYEVYEKDDYIGLFYFDLFPRETKKSGAWMTSIREQGLFKNQIVRPHVGIVCNFTKPTKDQPSLLTLEEVKTLFHEFGHALHGLLSKVHYRSLAGTNVYWDFVELPSQIMENWVKEKETLDLFARHYQTQEKIPYEIIEKIKRSENFHAGIQFLTQLNYGYLDLYYHTTDPSLIKDVVDFEKKVTEKTRLFPEPDNVCISTGFSHIFAGGYSAGYYSYKWAEVLEADAFEYFKEKGIFSQEVAEKFKKYILEKGNTEDPLELYKAFRGREPDVKSLLRKFRLLNENGKIAG